MTKRALLAACIVLLPAATSAQTSAYQTADGQTSIFLANAKANLIFNVSDSTFTVGYLKEEAGYRRPLFGFEFTGKPSTSLSMQVFQKGPAPPAIGAAASVGLHSMFAPEPADQKPGGHLRDDWGLLQFTYSRSTFKLANSADSQPDQIHFDDYQVLAAYNALINVRYVGLLAGAAAGVHRTNNINDLTPVTINSPVLQSAPGVNPSFEVVTQDTGYTGDYKQYTAVPVYTDTVIIPKSSSWITVDIFTRSSAASQNRYFGAGIGLFIAQPANPTSVLGGLSVGWKSGVPTWALVAGWSF